MFAYWYCSASINCWMRAGVFSARNVRRFAGDKPKLSPPSRRIPFLDSLRCFKGKAATLLGSCRKYTELDAKPDFGSSSKKPAVRCQSMGAASQMRRYRSGDSLNPTGASITRSTTKVFAGQAVGIEEVHDDIWLVSFMNHDLGYFDLETRVLEPLENRFGPKVSPM